MAVLGPRLRTVVVTLDPGGNESRTDSPACLLRALGHEVIVAGFDLTELEARAVPADVVIVEAGEHLEIGRSAIQRLRQRPELIAARILLSLEVARVMAFTAEIGADDFILSPISLEELAARLWQLRARDNRPRAPLQLRYGEIVLDCEELLSRVWGYRHAGGGRTVDTHTLNLRRKLGDHGERLQSVLGVGYKLQRLDAPPERAVPPARKAPTVYQSAVVRNRQDRQDRQDRPDLPRAPLPAVPDLPYDFDRVAMPASRRSS